MRTLLIAATLAAAAGLSHGGDLSYDRQAGPQRAALESLLVRTVVCMREAVPARMAGGVRDSNEVAQWAVEVCAVPLGRFMVSDMGFTPTDAATYLFAMGQAAIDETPGVRRHK